MQLLAENRPQHAPHSHTSTPLHTLLLQAALFTSYFMAAWAWRGMEFTIALVLLELYPKSLLLVSLYGLLDNGMTFTLGGAVGE